MALRLIIEDEEGSTTVVPLGQAAVTIGRQAGNTIQLTEQNVSRKHARMYPQSDGWVVEDLQSYNGIRVNGVAIEARVLVQTGDLVQIGDYHLALSDDVDKETLNLDRKEAANDDEPLLASSSAHLPKVAQEELAAAGAAEAAPAATPIAAGTGSKAAAGTVGASPAAVEDRGPVPFVVQERKSSSAMLIALVAAGVVIVGLSAALIMGGDDEADGPKPEPVGSGELSVEPAAAPAPAAGPAPIPAAIPVDPSAVAPSPAEPTGEEPTGEEPAGEEPAAEEEVVEEEEPAAGSSKRKRRRRKPSGKSSGSGAAPPPPPPAEPGADPDDLLKQARKASLTGNATQAYKLAKQAYGIKKSQSALEVMGVAACKMGDSGKAKSAYKKLSGKKKENLAKVCASKGITLE